MTMAMTGSTPLDKSWFLERERAAAWLRLAFAVLAIAIIQLNPVRVARFPLMSGLVLGFFLFYSGIALVFVLRRKFTFSRFGSVATALDVVWIALIVFSTGGTRTPFFFYYTFPVITASLRWGLKGSLPVAFIGVAIYASIRLTLAAEAGAEPIGIDTIVVRSLYLVFLAGIFGYISEFEKSQNQKLLALSQTAAHVATLQERRRIMFDIHDGILQSLATLILRLEITRGRLPESQSEAIQELQAAEELTRSTMQDLRAFLAGKTDHPIMSGTLVALLQDELRFIQEGLGLEVTLDCEPENLNLPAEIEREVYYVLREGLTNITRHSHASRVQFRLNQSASAIEVSLQDDGVGMDLATVQNGHGLGLPSMKERIEKLGGKLALKSSPSSGTRVSFSVPLAR
ncbi:MAG: sensor histidine kinase [Candidatus Binatia bacterium]